MSVIRQISLYDEETGEFISSNSEIIGNKLKEGWIVIYKKPLVKLLNDCPNFATLKVYLRIAAAQEYDTVTYITTPYLAKALCMSYQTAWNAVKWLVANAYIKKTENVTGSQGFIVNPLVSTCGKKNYEKKVQAFIEENNITAKDLREAVFDDDVELVEDMSDLPKARNRNRNRKAKQVEFPGAVDGDMSQVVDEDGNEVIDYADMLKMIGGDNDETRKSAEVSEEEG